MSVPETSEIPELKQIVGALIFGARQPLTLKDVRRTVEEVAEELGGLFAPFASLKDRDVREALDLLRESLEKARTGLVLVERPEGFTIQSEASCGPWVRHLLDLGKSSRLSRPALETLAIIAYKQPVTRAELEAVRGVSADHIMKTLMELQLVRIVGRSELPGKPLLYGTTKVFLDHFGLRELKELPGLEELSRMESLRRQQAAAAPAPGEGGAPAAEGAEQPQAEPAPAEPAAEPPAGAPGPEAGAEPEPAGTDDAGPAGPGGEDAQP